MARLAGLVLALVLVSSAPAAAATATEDVPVPGGSAALSRLLGIDPPPARGRPLAPPERSGKRRTRGSAGAQYSRLVGSEQDDSAQAADRLGQRMAGLGSWRGAV